MQDRPPAYGSLADGTSFYAPLGEMLYGGDERVCCHLCGRWMKAVGGTHLRWHGWTIDDYREAFRLGQQTPTCAPGVSSRLAQATERHVGRNGFGAPPRRPAATRTPPPAWRSLAQVRPELVGELHPTANGSLDPREIAAGSHRKLWWQCATCGHEWEASASNRVARASGFAPGAIGFRAMTKVPYNGDPFGGAQVAAYIGAQSVIQRLNAVAPGRWRQEFRLTDPPPGAKRLYMACWLTVTLPITEDGPEAEAVYEDVGEMDSGSRAGLKALYSDARKRAGVAAGIGAYLYTALERVVLPIGTGDRQVKLIRRSGKADTLALSPATEQWLRHGYEQRMSTDAVRRDLGEILAHGEPEQGMGQGEAAEQPADEASEAVAATGDVTDAEGEAARGPDEADGNGVVVVDFGDLGPQAA